MPLEAGDENVPTRSDTGREDAAAGVAAPIGYVGTAFLRTLAGFAQHIKQRSYELMQVQEGQTVLDVGCGPGTDTINLAHLVGPAGQVVGVDLDADMLVEADHRAEQAGVSGWVRHVVSNATSLPFDDDSFDAVRSERLFGHLPEPAAALGEMIRVTKVGGWIVALEPDWGTLSLDVADVDLERRISRLAADRLYNGYSGRQLYRLFKQQALLAIRTEPVPLYTASYELARQAVLLDDTERAALERAIITPEELERWHASLEEADREGVFFGTMTQIIVAGQKG